MDRQDGQTWRTDVVYRFDRPTWWTDMTDGHDEQTWWTDVTDRCNGQTWWTDVMDRCDRLMWWTDVMDGRDGQTWWKDVTDRRDGRTWQMDVMVGHDSQTWRRSEGMGQWESPAVGQATGPVVQQWIWTVPTVKQPIRWLLLARDQLQERNSLHSKKNLRYAAKKSFCSHFYLLKKYEHSFKNP